MILTALLIALVVIVFFVAFLLLRTLTLHTREQEVEKVDVPDLDVGLIARHLSEAIRCQTVSQPVMTEKEREPWRQLSAVLHENYPTLHRQLSHKVVNDYSLLYTWKGTDPSLKPILLAAHLDVVPVEKATEKEWAHPPFTGAIDREFVWGRGALDMKNHLITLLEAVEFLLNQGFTPKRTIYLAFGHDEEIYGQQGALQISKWLEQQGIKLGAVLDEGGQISQGLLPGVQTPLAVVNTAEKGFLTLLVSASGKPGHSSMPPRQTAIGIVARALALLDDHPMPADLATIKPLLKKAGSALPLTWQIMLANDWLFKHLLVKELEKSILLNAQIRTTAAATMISGGVKDNILPASAEAKVNFRLIPGDTIERVKAYVAKTIADPRVILKIEDQSGWDPSNISPMDTPAYYTLELAIKQVFGNIPVALGLDRGATDARHYENICKNIYRFTPVKILPEDTSRVHGINERIRIEHLRPMVAFFIRLVRLWGEAEF